MGEVYNVNVVPFKYITDILRLFIYYILYRDWK